MGQVFMTKNFRRFRRFCAEFCWLEGDDFELEEVGQKSRLCKRCLLRRDFLFCSELLYIHICFYMYTYGCEPGNTGPRIINKSQHLATTKTNKHKDSQENGLSLADSSDLTVDGIYGNAWGLCRLG